MDDFIYVKIATDLDFEASSDVINLAIKKQELKTLIDVCERSKMILMLDYRE